MLHIIRFNGSGQVQFNSSTNERGQKRVLFAGEKQNTESPKHPINMVKLSADSADLMANSAESAETIGAPIYRQFLQRFLKTDEPPRLAHQMQGSRLFGPKTLAQHTEQLVHLLTRIARIPIPNQLEQGRLSLNEAFRKNHPFLAHGVLKHLHGKAGVHELNRTDRYGLTAFYTAVLTGHLPEARMILKQGADPFIPDKNGKSILDLLADYGEVRQLDSLLDEAKLDRFEQKKADALKAMARVNQALVADYLHHYQTFSAEEKEVAVRQIAKSDLDPAQETDQRLRMMALLKLGTNVNAPDQFGQTALHYVVQKGRADLFPALLQAGANVNATDSHGNQPLHSAVIRNRNNMVTLLLQAGAEVNTGNGSGNTPLILASYYSYGKVVKALLDEGAKVNVANIFGETPLHMIAHSENGFSEVVHALLEAGASMDVVDKKGQTPMDKAIAREHDNVIRILNQATSERHPTEILNKETTKAD